MRRVRIWECDFSMSGCHNSFCVIIRACNTLCFNIIDQILSWARNSGTVPKIIQKPTSTEPDRPMSLLRMCWCCCRPHSSSLQQRVAQRVSAGSTDSQRPAAVSWRASTSVSVQFASRLDAARLHESETGQDSKKHTTHGGNRAETETEAEVTIHQWAFLGSACWLTTSCGRSPALWPHVHDCRRHLHKFG